jgi:hypothetical protein
MDPTGVDHYQFWLGACPRRLITFTEFGVGTSDGFRFTRDQFSPHPRGKQVVYTTVLALLRKTDYTAVNTVLMNAKIFFR